MKPVCIALLLQLCFLTGIAAAQSEIEVEGRKLLTTLFTKCGDDYFSKRTYKYKTGTAYIIGQYKELAPKVKSNPLNKTDPLNGVEWKGVISFTASVGREYAHGEELVRRGTKRLNTWRDWKTADLGAYIFVIEKRNGVVNTKQRSAGEISGISCSEVPR